MSFPDEHQALALNGSPPLLLIFFHDRSWNPQPPASSAALDSERAISPSPSVQTGLSGTSSSKRSQRFEFLLFSYLLRFVHREGRIGDFARAGLLFLFDIAFLPVTESELVGRAGDTVDPLQEVKNSLAEFVLDGDTCDVVAAGLGAVFSVLPTKLRVPALASQLPDDGGAIGGGMHLGGDKDTSDDVEEARGLPLSTDEDVQSQLDLLLKLLGFVHDVLARCTVSSTVDAPAQAVTPAGLIGPAIARATLASIDASFLGGILYPSILESSPSDGSSVAVLTYLQVILTQLDDGPLLRSMMRYLLGLDPEGRFISAGARKKSSAMILLEREQRPSRSNQDYFTADGRFTLKDLILDNIRSGVPAATTSALGLLQSLLAYHCGECVEGVLVTAKVDFATALAKPTLPTDHLLAVSNENEPASPSSEVFIYREYDSTTAGGSQYQLPQAFFSAPTKCESVHRREMELYAGLLQQINRTSSSTHTWHEGYMTDVLHVLRDDPCFVRSITTTGSDDEPMASPTTYQQHRLSPSDPILRSVLRLIADFFAHTVDENVALTGVASALAICPNRSLAGWMVCETARSSNPSEDWDAPDISDGNDDRSLDGEAGVEQRAEFEPAASIKTEDLPALYQVLSDLTRQMDSFRAKVEDFDRYLSERRQGLLFADHLDDAMNVLLDVNAATFPEPTNRRELPKPRSSVASSIRSFLTPKKRSDPPQAFSAPSTPAKTPTHQGNAAASPFNAHYSQTKAITVHHRAGNGVEAGPWSPARRRVSEDPFKVSSDGEEEAEAEELITRSAVTTVTLSAVLDHCVVLEEFVKEITSIIMARRVCGVDQVAFI